MIGGLMKSTSTLALFAAAGLFAGGVMLAPAVARAADLGGDCCADLESRVADLEATTARKGNKKVSLTISGRINYNIVWWNENSTGPSSTPFDKTRGFNIGNAGRNESEFVLKGDGKISSDLTAGFSMETYADPTGNNGVKPPDLNQISNQGPPALQVQTTYVFLKSKSAGELRLGNQYGAIHDGFYQDLGTDVIGRYAQTRVIAQFKLRDSAGNLTDANYQSALKPIDDSRYDQLQYISPAFGGFTVKADAGGSNVAAVALLYDNKFGTVSVKGGFAYEWTSESDGSDQSKGIANVQVNNAETVYLSTDASSGLRILSSSASISESGSGLYLSGVYAQAYSAIAGRQDANNWMVKGGWQKNVTGIGSTDIYGSYFRENNLWANDTTGHIYAVGIDQAVDAVASDLYLQYQHDSYDTDGVIKEAAAPKLLINSQSIDAVIGGMIIRF